MNCQFILGLLESELNLSIPEYIFAIILSLLTKIKYITVLLLPGFFSQSLLLLYILFFNSIWPQLLLVHEYSLSFSSVTQFLPSITLPCIARSIHYSSGWRSHPLPEPHFWAAPWCTASRLWYEQQCQHQQGPSRDQQALRSSPSHSGLCTRVFNQIFGRKEDRKLISTYPSHILYLN